MTFNSWTTEMPQYISGKLYMITELHTGLPTGKVVSKIIKKELIRSEGESEGENEALHEALAELNALEADVHGGLPDDVIDLYLAGKGDEARWKIDDMVTDDQLDDQLYYSIRQIAANYADAAGMDEDELADELADRWEGWGNDWIGELVREQSVMIAVVLDLEWEYQGWHLVRDLKDNGYEGIDHVLEFFGISPHLVAEYYGLEDRESWPELPEREPIVKPNDLFSSWDNTVNSGEYAIMWGTDLETAASIVEHIDGGGSITLKKGSNIVIHDYLNGASSTLVRTTKDVTITKYLSRLINDGARKYGIQSCCGFTSGTWGESEIVMEEIDPATMKTTAKRVVGDDGYALLHEGETAGKITYWSKATDYETSVSENYPHLSRPYENGYVMRQEKQFPTNEAARKAWGLPGN